MNKATIVITLEYDLHNLRVLTGRDIPEEDFAEEVEEYAFHDLMDLIRTNKISEFGDILFTEEDN